MHGWDFTLRCNADYVPVGTFGAIEDNRSTLIQTKVHPKRVAERTEHSVVQDVQDRIPLACPVDRCALWLHGPLGRLDASGRTFARLSTD